MADSEEEDDMSNRRAALGAALLWPLLGSACSGPERVVVDNYFNAVNHQDNQTLSSFALVQFEKRVDKWSITAVSPETRSPASLPELVKTAKEVESALAANKKEYSAYFNQHPKEVDEVQDLLKKAQKAPPRLAGIAADWEKFIQKERGIKKALAEAKDAVEKEKRNMTLSVGSADENAQGDVLSKQVDL